MRKIDKIVESHVDHKEQSIHYVVICSDQFVWEVTFDVRRGKFGERKRIEFPDLPQIGGKS